MKAQDLMTEPAISVKADVSLAGIIHLLNSHQINNVPVLDSDERVIGMIGWHQLFPKVRKFRSPDVRIPILFRQIVDYKHIVDSYKQSGHIVAKDIMTPSPLCVDVNDEIDSILMMMVEKNLHTVPVLRAGRLAGVLTRSDFIQFLAQEL